MSRERLISRVSLAGLLTVGLMASVVRCNTQAVEQGAAAPAMGSVGNVSTAVQQATQGTCSSCFGIHLGNYNVFVLENYSEILSIQGKVAAGGNVTLNGFSVGTGLSANDI